MIGTYSREAPSPPEPNHDGIGVDALLAVHREPQGASRGAEAGLEARPQPPRQPVYRSFKTCTRRVSSVLAAMRTTTATEARAAATRAAR